MGWVVVFVGVGVGVGFGRRVSGRVPVVAARCWFLELVALLILGG